MSRRILTIIAACLSLAACNMKETFAPDPAAKALAEAAYAKLVAGDIDGLFADMPKEADTDQQRRLSGALRALIPEGQAKSGKIVGINKNVSTGAGHTQVLTYDYDYGSEKVRFTASLQRKSDAEPWRLMGVNLAPADANGFDLGAAASLPPPKPAASKAPAD